MWIRTIKIISLLCLFLLGGCQSVKLSEKHYLLPDKPITQKALDSKGFNQKLTYLTLQASDGNQLGGIAVIQPNAKFTTLYFGGNQTRIKQVGDTLVKHLSGFDNNLVAFDHRGYGLSHGEPTIEKLKSDAQAVFDFIKAQPDLNNLPIVVHGLSLGSMIAADLAQNRDIDGLVLEGSTTTVNDMLDEVIPVLVKPFIDVEIGSNLTAIDNSKILAKNTKPLLIVVGEKDYVTPIELSKKLYQVSISDKKSLLIVDDKKHGNATDSQQFKTAFMAFTETLLTDKE
ncbi:alpha/beta hydrolase [Shewanella sp. OPT22]|nr:alpha/beta hydrolase [Shewanella sp. OPT22]